MNLRLETPWGPAQTCERRGPFLEVSTVGHGGVYVPDVYNAKIPMPWRRASGWYEEDCDWCIPVLCFPEHFPADLIPQAKRTAEGWHPGLLGALTEEQSHAPRA